MYKSECDRVENQRHLLMWKVSQQHKVLLNESGTDIYVESNQFETADIK